MMKLDRLVWAAGISFRAYGVRIGVRVNTPGGLELIRDYLPPGSKISASQVVDRLYSFIVGDDQARTNVRRFHLLYANEARIARSLDIEFALKWFESDSQFYIAEKSPRRVFVHAGVVGWRGQAVLIPGRSFTGKTTLVTEFVKAGAVYYSDEFAVLDSKGLVHPYPRPLAIREDGSSEPKRYSVESLGGSRGARPLPVGLVAVTEYKAGARWRPLQMTPGQGVLALLNNTVSIKDRPEASFPVLKQTAASAPFIRSKRGEARETVDSIMTELEKVSR